MGIASIYSAAVDTLNSITEVGIKNVSRPSAYAADVEVDLTGIPMNVSTRTCWIVLSDQIKGSRRVACWLRRRSVLLSDHSQGAG
jgi:hypothetical protein